MEVANSQNHIDMGAFEEGADCLKQGSRYRFLGISVKTRTRLGNYC